MIILNLILNVVKMLIFRSLRVCVFNTIFVLFLDSQTLNSNNHWTAASQSRIKEKTKCFFLFGCMVCMAPIYKTARFNGFWSVFVGLFPWPGYKKTCNFIDAHTRIGNEHMKSLVYSVELSMHSYTQKPQWHKANFVVRNIQLFIEKNPLFGWKLNINSNCTIRNSL